MSKYKGSGLFYHFISSVLYILFKVLFRFKTYGTQNVPQEADRRGVILAPNHASFLDPPILGISLQRRVTFLAKEYLFKNFVVGIVLRGIGAYPIKSEKDDFRSIRDLIRLLKAGQCVVVFPEGTRSADGQMKAPESGIGFLAAKSAAYVVPVYIHGSYEAFPPAKGGSASGGKKGGFFKLKPVQAYYGEPFIPAEDKSLMEAQDPYGAVSREIMARIARIKAQVDAGKFLK